MPPYNANPGVNTPVNVLQPGVTGYAFGSFDADFPTTLLQVSNVALTGNFATVTVALREGKVPTTDGKISIRGTTSESGAFNVENVDVSVVNIDEATGEGTISFVLVHADVVSTPDNGMAYVPVPEIGEALVEDQSSQAFAIQDIAGHNENGLTLQWSVDYPSPPSTVLMTLECADFDEEDQYVMTDSNNATGPSSRSISLTRYRFIRVTASGIAGGTDPTCVVRFNI